MQGWISLHRKILENPIICKDTEHFSVWCYLLLNATHKERDVMFEGKKKTLKNGELIVGRKKISEFLGVSESKVQRILKTFEIEQQIEQQTTPRNRCIRIIKWEEYQDSEQQIKQQLNNKRTTTEQQLNTNNNINNINNINKANKKDKESEGENPHPHPPNKFSKPSFDDVSDYCFELKSEIDPQRFIDHYESNGWMVGKNKMKDWKAAIRNWIRREQEDKVNSKSKPTQTNNPFLDMVLSGELREE